MTPRRKSPGFTLVELSVVLAVMAIIATFATPSFVAWHLRDQVDARARALVSMLSLARSEAVKRGARVTLCRSTPRAGVSRRARLATVARRLVVRLGTFRRT